MDNRRNVPRKVLNYVIKDSSSKIKLYIRRHRLDLAECCTPAGASVLHLAAELGSELCMRYLMKAYPHLLEEADDHGDLPLHKAVVCLLASDDDDHVVHTSLDIVEPLLAAYPSALRVPNCRGQTAEDLLTSHGWQVRLGRLSKNPSCEGKDRYQWHRSHSQSEDNFYEKLFENLDEDFGCSSFSDHDYHDNGARETYDQWAERISAERRQKQQRQQREHDQVHQDNKQPDKSKHAGARPPRGASRRAPEAEGYGSQQVLGPLKRPASEKTELRVKRARHEQAMRLALQQPAEAPPLGMTDFPWPTGNSRGSSSCHAPTAAAMVNVLLSDIDVTDLAAVRVCAKELLKTWHPDKIEQKFGTRLLKSARAGVLDKVKEIAQILNSHLQKS